MLSGVFVNIVQSMTFAIASSGRLRHRLRRAGTPSRHNSAQHTD
ncbi:hypothetical protein [Nostoc sp.]